ncbi:Spy/CpxP family protein refolding chaperone [Tumidithrix elongata RA019]|uniref:Spy/CpxP family protein refolding chaperone n=1 Tax=Tumidithrix elongata BACA0141 TaxID=2716417 RepID=A0AAW9Q392_9CYAN|nr:Spy/CpxP family protein refolding chaperone [Tumidithrix elongata RA019]
MKFKLIPLVSAAIAALSIATPTIVLAQSMPGSPTSGDRMMAPHPGGGGHMMPPDLGLTEQQKTQLDQIRKSTRAQIEGIVTPDQKQQVKTAIDNGEDFREAMDSVLSSEQKTQIRAIMQASRKQMQAVLTPEQQQKMRQHMQQQFMNRGN